MWQQKMFEVFTTTIPPSFALLLLCFSLNRIKIKFRHLLIFAVVFSLFPVFLRQYVAFGVHSIISLIVLVYFTIRWGGANIFSASMLGVITLLAGYVSESITLIGLKFTNFDFNVLDNDPVIRAIIGIVPIAIVLSFGLSVYYVNETKNKWRLKIKTLV